MGTGGGGGDRVPTLGGCGRWMPLTESSAGGGGVLLSSRPESMQITVGNCVGRVPGRARSRASFPLLGRSRLRAAFSPMRDAVRDVGRPAGSSVRPGNSRQVAAYNSLTDRPSSPQMPSDDHDRSPPAPQFDETSAFLSAIKEQVGQVVVGQEVVVERILIALLTGSHLLLEGVPGLAKTLLVAAVSKTVDLDFARISSRSTCCRRTSSARRSSTSGRPDVPDAQGADLHQPPAGRRDQPRARRAEGPERAARGDAGAAHHDRQRELRAARCRSS